jgi:tRNA U34 2-thiouridine synthase MnmA/TrmU
MKAIALISGGLDSTLAARLIKKQGIDILPLNFKIPFCHRVKNVTDKEENKLAKAADNLGSELKTVDISGDFLNLVKNPEHGFGSNMNPCIDCKILMLRKTKELMRGWNAAFVVTGEVLGQRPMSQHKQALETIVTGSGLEGLVLRPLSARLLTETIPEKEGWIERNRLLNFSGRSRKPQMALAKKMGIKTYLQPAGGCLLTDPRFTNRLKDLISHQELNLDNIELLKIGRHFRISDKAKLVVGRDEKENEKLASLAQEEDYLFTPNKELAGPTSLGRGILNEELLKACCSITCRYCDSNGKSQAQIFYKKISEKQENSFEVCAIEDARLQTLRI